MNDQVVMSPKNGQLAIAIPLFRHIQSDAMINTGNYVIAFKSDDPKAYVLDFEDYGLTVVSSEWAHKYLEFLGEL